MTAITEAVGAEVSTVKTKVAAWLKAHEIQLIVGAALVALVAEWFVK